MVDEVEFVTNVHYEESLWMKVRGGSALYIITICIYLLIVIEGCNESPPFPHFPW